MALTVEAIMNNLMAYPEVAAVGFVAGFLARWYMGKRNNGGAGGGWG
ncbi:hypothetical protein GKQ38_05155 [Candidatus Nanohaloarchaea archaeon]|nr:hypothetical protein GKQ38_05155 [Candidatus Nanohaloarchaea archaeon]